MPVTAVYFAPDHPDPIQYVQYFGLVDGSVWAGRAGHAASTRGATAGVGGAGAGPVTSGRLTYADLGQLMYDDAIILPVVNPTYHARQLGRA